MTSRTSKRAPQRYSTPRLSRSARAAVDAAADPAAAVEAAVVVSLGPLAKQPQPAHRKETVSADSVHRSQ